MQNYANIIFVYLHKVPTFNVEQNYNINWFEKRTGLNLNVFSRFFMSTDNKNDSYIFDW